MRISLPVRSVLAAVDLAAQAQQVKSELGETLLASFYNGATQRRSSLPERLSIENPATQETLCEVEIAEQSMVKEAINAADQAFHSGVWSQASPAHRAKVLTDVSRALTARLPELIMLESLQTGRCIREMRAQLTRVPEWLDYHAALARSHEGLVLPTQGNLLNYVKRYPLGVVAQITPFNHPLLIAMKKIAPALAAGNSIIVKPSELAPITVGIFAEIATEAGIPSGVLNVLYGGKDTARWLINDERIKKVDITAGTAAGRTIGATVGARNIPFTAELGGKAPVIVFSDADIPSAVAGTCFSAFVASGQTCVSGTRLLVQEDVYEEFMSALVDRVRSITERIGSPQNPESTMGPVISQRALDRILSALKQLSPPARIVAGGSRLTGKSKLDGTDLSKGYFMAPTIVEEPGLEDPVWRDELFGPVIAVRKFKTEAQALALANSTPYSLGAGLFTQSLPRAHRVAAQINAGIVWINTWHRNDPSSPWGGMGGASGVGRENGVEAYEAYTQSKSVIVNLATPQESRTDDWFAEAAVSQGVRYG